MTVIDVDFWAGRWSAKQIGFHEGHPNTFLERHVDRLGQGRRVLVPLCGKAEDMAFLASRGHQVVGVEVIEDAVVQFFQEHELEPTIEQRDDRVRVYSAGALEILVGNVFDVTPSATGPIDAFYDRAALVALPPSVRPRYVAHLRTLIARGAAGLVITFAYESDTFEPPPFSVTFDEVTTLYEGADVQPIDRGPFQGARLKAAGVVGEELCLAIRL